LDNAQAADAHIGTSVTADDVQVAVAGTRAERILKIGGAVVVPPVIPQVLERGGGQCVDVRRHGAPLSMPAAWLRHGLQPLTNRCRHDRVSQRIASVVSAETGYPIHIGAFRGQTTTPNWPIDLRARGAPSRCRAFRRSATTADRYSTDQVAEIAQ